MKENHERKEKMMKKKMGVLVCMLMVLMAVVLNGCGSSSKVSSNNTKVGKEAVAVIDKFLDGRSNATSTLSSLDICYNNVGNEDGSKSDLLRAYIQNASTAVFSHGVVLDSGVDYGDNNVVNKRNELAKFVGASQR